MPLRPRALLISALSMILAASASAQQQPATATPAQPPASAQEQSAQHKRPTVGLVLQGGGALGLAHIGVITWLEEHHIPVDYIAGTSMGGLVGGVYATGHNAAEMRQIVNGIPWDEVLSPMTPFDDLAFRRKEDAR